MFNKKSNDKIKKIDILITSIVLGTIISGAFGLKKIIKRNHEESVQPKEGLIIKIFKIFLGK